MSRKKTTNTRTGYYASSYSKDYAGRGSSMSRRPNRGPSRVKEVLIILLALLALAAAIFGLVKLVQHHQAEKGPGLKTSSVATAESTTANVGTARVLTDEEKDMLRNSEKYKNIMAHKEDYPEYLIDDLEMNPEILDFVADYLKVQPVGHSGLTAAEKNARLERLAIADAEWQQSEGMPSVLRKHIDKECRRVLVFCTDVPTLTTMGDVVRTWFEKAGLKVNDVFILHNELTDRQQRDAMEAFESDKGEGCKIMMSVDMLNEGVHVPRGGAVLMLRTTRSRIVFMQQMGRCLTAANVALNQAVLGVRRVVIGQRFGKLRTPQCHQTNTVFQLKIAVIAFFFRQRCLCKQIKLITRVNEMS